MSEQTNSILLQVRIDEQAAKKKLADLQKDLITARREEAALNAEIKKSGTVTDEQAAKLVALKSRLKDLTTEQKLQTSALEAQVKADKSKTGSIDQLKEQIKLLTTQWNSLSEEERDNAEIGGVIQKATKATNDRLRELGASVSDNRRNVGNYKNDIKEAAGEMSFLGNITAKYDEAQKTLNATMVLAKAGIGGNVSALKLLKIALAATGIGLLVIGLGSLVAVLTKSQAGMDWLAQKTAGLSAIMSKVVSYLTDAGIGIINFVNGFENLGDAVKKIGNLILENIINRFKGLSVILDGLVNRDFTKIQDGIVQVGTGLTDATAKAKKFTKELNEARKAGEAIAKETQRIRDAETELTRTRAKSRAEIEKLKMLSDDTNRSTKQRIEDAQKAFKLEQDLLAKEIALQRRKVAVIEEENKHKGKNNVLAADRQKLAEEAAKLDELREDSLGKQTELNNKLNSLRAEGAAKAAEAAKALSEAEYEALQRRLADQKAAIEVEVLQTKEGTDERLKAVLALNEKEREIALSAKDLTNNQAALLQAQHDQKELDARREHAQRLLDVAKEQAEKFKAQKEADYQEALQKTEQYYAEERLKITQQLANQEVSQQQYQTRLDELQRLSIENAIANAADYNQSTTESEQQLAEHRIEQRQKEADEKARIAEAEYQTAVAVSTAMADLMTLFAGQSAAAAEFAKAVTLFQIGLSTADAIAKGIASSQSLPFPGNLLAMATTISTVTANILQAKQLISGDSPKAPKFATGGVLSGPSHAQGGIQVYNRQGAHIAEVEGDETILTGEVSRTPMLLQAASLINQMAGGKALTVGTFHQKGGILPGATRDYLSSGATTIDYDKLGKAVGDYVPKYIKTTDIKGSLDKQTAKAKIINQ